MQRDHAHFERVCLGAMLDNEIALRDGLAMLQESHFQIAANRVLFRCMVEMQGGGRPVEYGALLAYLSETRRVEDVGGLSYAMSLVEQIPRDINIAYYADQVKDSARLALLATMCERVMREALDGERSAEELEADMTRTITQAQSECGGSAMVPMDELVPRAVDRMLNPERRPPAIPTGIGTLDARTLGGIRPKELWVWGGLPGRGKTTGARQVARHAASLGVAVAVFSIEMANEEWSELDIATEANVVPWKVRRQILDRDDRSRIVAAGDRMLKWRMFYEDSGALHIRSLIRKARMSVLRNGVQLVVVDYVQRIKSDEKEVRHRIGNVAEALAEFAKSNNVAVILLSQLARRGDVNVRPTMQDLKESGELEAHAHTVLLNYRPVDQEKTSGTLEAFSGLDEIIIGKQRFGPTGSVPVKYNGDFMRFDPR